jgi:hypothetical protein
MKQNLENAICIVIQSCVSSVRRWPRLVLSRNEKDAYVHACAYMDTSMFIHVCMCTCMYRYVHVYILPYVCVCVCVYKFHIHVTLS